jgi:hypothetical protein
MRQVAAFDIGLQTPDDLVLADDIVEPIRPVLLYPDLLFDRKPSRRRFELSIYQYSSKK